MIIFYIRYIISKCRQLQQLPALQYKAEGFKAVKMKVGLGINTDVKYIQAVRKAIGNDMDLMIDANDAFSLREVKQLIEKIDDQQITWFEEPISNEDYNSYAKLRRWSKIPISAGECEYLKYGPERPYRPGLRH